MPPLTAALTKDLVDFLTPHLGGGQAEMRLTLALGGCAALDGLDYKQSGILLAFNVVTKLEKHGDYPPGRRAVCTLLESLAEELVGRRDEIQSLLDRLEGDTMLEALLGLDFAEQDRAFADALARDNAAACLIYGPHGHGQRWLVNRLCRAHVPRAEPLVYDFSRQALPRDVGSVWRDLAGRLGLERPRDGSDAARAPVVGSLCKRLATTPVALVFFYADLIGPAMVLQLLTAFWRPLRDKVRTYLPARRQPLLMFLVDHGTYRKYRPDWLLRDDLPANGPPPAVVVLPPLVPFTESVLRDWLRDHGDRLDVAARVKLDARVGEIVVEAGGEPEGVLEWVCEENEPNSWHAKERAWLRI